MINYIKILNRQIEIHYSNKMEIINLTLNKYLDCILLNQLTTYKGRLEAIKSKYKIKKLVPIYIDTSLCLIPVMSKKNVDNMYINIYSVNYIKDNTIITFFNNEEIKININYNLVKKYIQRAWQIQK